jgi:hypothetical protein
VELLIMLVLVDGFSHEHVIQLQVAVADSGVMDHLILVEELEPNLYSRFEGERDISIIDVLFESVT